MKEQFKMIPDFGDKYAISNKGRVISYHYGKTKELKPEENENGYLRVTLSYNGKRQRFFIHVLVANAFLKKPKDATEVNHKDCNKQFNWDTNLEWTTRRKNIEHAIEHGKIEAKAVKGIHLKTGEVIKCDSMHDAAFEVFGSRQNAGHISQCCSGLRKSCGGYAWGLV